MPTFDSYRQGTPSWVELVTPDHQAGSDFYAQLFGWQVDLQPADDQGGVSGVGRLGDAQIAGISGQVPDLAGHPAYWNVYLATDDVDAAAQRVIEAGGEVEAGPFDVGAHGRMAAIKDPVGARVNLWQAGQHVGTGLANEPGTPIWNELIAPGYQQALPFYEQVLGIGSDTQDYPGMGPYTTLQVEGASVAGASEPPPGAGGPPHWNVYFNVASADDSAARAQELGGTQLGDLYDVPGVGRIAHLRDPQGGGFNLLQNPPEA